MSVNREILVGLWTPVVRPVGGDERLAQLLHGGIAAVAEMRLLQHDPVRPSALLPVERTDASALAAHADLRLLVHLDLGDQPAGRRIPPGELDAGRLPDHTAPAVAPHEVLRPERPAVGERDVNAGSVLREARQLAFADDRHCQLVDPAGQDALEVSLPQRESVVVVGWGSR